MTSWLTQPAVDKYRDRGYPDLDAPFVEWKQFLTNMDWRQGEHVTLIGHTGAGKTELTLALLRTRKYVVFLGTKSKDDTQDALHDMGYKFFTDSKSLEVDVAPHIVIRPKFPKVNVKELKDQHREVFRETIMRAYRQGGWTIVLDEARYITEFLGLKDEVMLCWLQGRSKGISVVANTQRPRFIPLEAYDSATHLFFWRSSDLENVRRVGELAGINRDKVVAIVGRLQKYDVLYVDTRDGSMYVTNSRS